MLRASARDFEQVDEPPISDTLFRSIEIHAQQSVVIKCVDNQKPYEKSELVLNQNIDHPFIACYYGVVDDIENAFMVIEDVGNLSLLDLIRKGGIIEFEIQRIFCQLLISVMYLHNEKNVAHRDLKLENIMLDSERNVRLIDFGISRQGDIMTTICGSYPYVAPEIYQGRPYDKSIDVWSLGVILYVLCCGHLPFNGENQMELAEKIISVTPSWPTHVSLDLVDLLRKMLEKDPANRIKIDEIPEHPWLTRGRYAPLLEIDWRSPKFKVGADNVADVDCNVVQKMVEMGFNQSDVISEALEGHGDTTLSMVYRILRRAAVRKNCLDAMLMLVKPKRKSLAVAPSTFPLSDEPSPKATTSNPQLSDGKIKVNEKIKLPKLNANKNTQSNVLIGTSRKRAIAGYNSRTLISTVVARTARKNH